MDVRTTGRATIIGLCVAVGCGGTSFSTGKSGSGDDAGNRAGADSGAGGAGKGGGLAAGGSNVGGSGDGGASSGGRGTAGSGAGGRIGSGGLSGTGAAKGGTGGIAMGGAGGTATGGASGAATGGTAGSPPNCAPEMTFKLVPGGPAGASQFCTSPPQVCGNGSNIAFLDASGKVLTTGLSCSQRSCEGCGTTPCPPYCALSTLIPSTGLTTTWLGMSFASGTCGGDLACFAPACAAPGSYVARMCGFALTGAGGSGGAGNGGSGGVAPNPCQQYASKTPTCVDVPFTVPTSDVVTGILDPRR